MRQTGWCRFSLRTLLIVLSLAAVGTAAYVRQAAVLERLNHHRVRLQQCHDIRDLWGRVSFDIPQWARVENDAQHNYHAALVAEYERALWRPWHTVHEPPPPERLGTQSSRW